MEAKAKEKLHRLVDSLPNEEVRAAERYLEYLAEHGDPFIRTLMRAAFDDESVTEEEEAGVREALDDYRAGRVQTLDEVEKEFGL
jgi:predicted transcriptional regulator